MELNGLKLVGSAVVVAGLLTGTFLAGNLTSAGTGDRVKPAAAYEVEEDPTATPAPLVEDQGQAPQVEEDEIEESPQFQGPPQAQPSAELEEDEAPVQQQPVQPTPIPAQPTPIPPAPEPAPVNDAPYVVSVIPSDGAIGITPDANIVLQFSESMDKASVQAAFNLSTGNCGIYAWNSDATQLTFKPCSDWAYGTVVDVELFDSAADKLGLGMDEEFESSFRILRQTTSKLYSEAARDGHVFVPGINNPAPTPYADAAQTTITLLNYTRGFLSFHLDELPEDLVQITGATVHARQASHSAQTYTAATGPVMIESVVYGTLTASDWGLQAKPLCAKICIGTPPTSRVFSDTAADGWKSTDMLIAVRNDWTEREARNFRSGFRLSFEKDCSVPCAYVAGLGFYSGDYIESLRPYLLVTYIHP